MTRTAIGVALGVSTEMTRQIELRAIAVLRRRIGAEVLEMLRDLDRCRPESLGERIEAARERPNTPSEVQPIGMRAA